METGTLEDFLALVDTRSFSRAAELRAVSQPSFSRRIKSLEDWVGAPLFDRSTHRLALTAAGESFRTVAEQTLRGLELGRESVRAVHRADHEALRFASTHALSFTFFPVWLRLLEAERPIEASISLTADHMVASEQRLVEGKAQFLLCHHHEATPTRFDRDFRSIKLGTDWLLPVATPELLASTDRDAAKQLAFSPESGMGRILASVRELEKRPPPPAPAFTSHLANVLTTMAREGRGVAWTALSLVQDDLDSGRLARAGTAQEDIEIEIRLWRHKSRQSPAAENLWARINKTR